MKAPSKNTYYRFLNDSTFNWRRFLLSLVAKVTSLFSQLTDSKRVKVFVLDDSIVTRNRSKSVELMARVYDHVTHKYQKGFTMLSSPNESNHLVNTCSTVDKRINGYKRRKEAIQKKPEAAIALIQNALKAGIMADYVLMGLFVDHLNNATITLGEAIKNQLMQWINSQAIFIKALFKDLKWES